MISIPHLGRSRRFPDSCEWEWRYQSRETSISVNIEAIPPDKEWKTAPEPTKGIIESVQSSPPEQRRFDVSFLDELNAEYEDRPLVPNPPSYLPGDRHKSAIGRITNNHLDIGLQHKTVPGIGCSEGYVVWYLGNDMGCDAYGVDLDRRASWAEYSGPNVHFTMANMAEVNPYRERMFDRVVSYAVWEHIQHPYTMLRETYRVMKPGALASITANLFMGPKASHRYRDIFFPWPHLLFSDEVVRDWDVMHGREPKGLSWVNRLSWAQYQSYFDEIGFVTKKVNFKKTPIDEEFYKRFENMLGRYPRRDLQRDFFTVILEKPDSPENTDQV